MLFTQSPIEGAIWTSFVGVQQWLVENIILSPLFKGIVFTWLGFLFIKAMFQMGTSKTPSQVIFKFVFALIISALGFSVLKLRSSETFRPTNSTGKTWDSNTKIRDSKKYSGLYTNTSGLFFYVQIHNGVNQVSSFISKEIGKIFKNEHANDSPYLLMQTLAQTATQTIDDPKSVASLNWLYENCINPRKAPILGQNSSSSNLFDLTPPDCSSRYKQFKDELTAWSKNKWGTSVWDKTGIFTAALKEKFGFISKETLQNKMIASALINASRSQMGRDNRQNVNTKALLTDASDPMTASGTSYFTGVSNTLSIGGAVNSILSPLTGTDYFGADFRNKSAYMYNQILQFLPPIRGYAKGLLALCFVFAAASMCFGTPRFMISWFGMLFIFALYEPLSTLLYESIMLFSNAKETTDAFQALQTDPLVLSGAAIIDDNLARIQAIYFALQIGVSFVCAAGGISIFMFTKRMSGGLSDAIVSKAVSYVALARGAPIGGGAPSAGQSPPPRA